MSDTNQEMKQEYNKRQSGKKRIGFSLSAIFTCLVSGIVLLISIITILIFIGIYRDAMKQNAVTSSEQAVAQVENMVPVLYSGYAERYGIDQAECTGC